MRLNNSQTETRRMLRAMGIGGDHSMFWFLDILNDDRQKRRLPSFTEKLRIMFELTI